MPTVFRSRGYRFFFYSNDHLPIHIHVERENKTAKFNVNPTELVQSRGFNAGELRTIRRLVNQHQELIITTWNEYFNN